MKASSTSPASTSGAPITEVEGASGGGGDNSGATAAVINTNSSKDEQTKTENCVNYLRSNSSFNILTGKRKNWNVMIKT